MTFVVTAGHRPAYSSGHHGGEPQLRAILDDFGKRFPKYVLNIAGHSHAYERTTPQSHVVHITAGIGAGPLEHAPTDCLWTECKQPPFIAYRAIHHGYVRLTVHSSTIAIEAVCGAASAGDDTVRCAAGQTIDQATINAGGSGGDLPGALAPRRGRHHRVAEHHGGEHDEGDHEQPFGLRPRPAAREALARTRLDHPVTKVREPEGPEQRMTRSRRRATSSPGPKLNTRSVFCMDRV